MKKTISMFLTIVMLFSMAPAVLASEGDAEGTPSPIYSDMSDSDWYAYAVENLAANGIHVGKSNNLFSPDDILTESDVITYLGQMGDTQGMKTAPADSEAHESVNSTSSNAEPPVTRQETIFDLYSFAERNDKNTTFNSYLANYSDGSQIDAYAVDAMNWGISAGIITEPQLSPGNAVSRADFAVLLNRYLRNIHDSEPDGDFSNDYGIRMEVPSPAQQTIEPGCDFYIIGDFIANVPVPDDAHVEVKITNRSNGSTPRILYCDKKNDYENLYVDYE